MSLPSDPNNAKPEVKTQKAAKTTAKQVSAPTVAEPSPMTAAQPTAPVDQKNYLVMMLLAVLALPTGLARAYIGDQSGWVRFWIFVGAYVLMIIPLVNLISGVIVFGLSVWGLIDLFLLRSRTHDAVGAPLVATPTDKKWANGFFVYAVVMIVLVTLLIITFFSLLGWAINSGPSFDSWGEPQMQLEQDWRDFDTRSL